MAEMMRRILCIAPHPDDETLGCGGTLLRHAATGDEIHWLVVTAISEAAGFSADRVASRAREIDAVAARYGFASVQRCSFPTMQLDAIPLSELMEPICKTVAETQADTLYLPYRNDAHTDHAAVFDAAITCSKSFRYPNVKSVYVYETLSETAFGLKPEDPGFRPNLFLDIADHLDEKIRIMELYEGEMSPFPFPRSETCMRALAQLRGSQCGAMAAEAFMILKEIR